MFSFGILVLCRLTMEGGFVGRGVGGGVSGLIWERLRLRLPPLVGVEGGVAYIELLLNSNLRFSRPSAAALA